jgi:hypothetical protein
MNRQTKILKFIKYFTIYSVFPIVVLLGIKWFWIDPTSELEKKKLQELTKNFNSTEFKMLKEKNQIFSDNLKNLYLKKKQDNNLESSDKK